jgi:hypothetical protein
MQIRSGDFIEISAKLINKTKNISNFIEVNHIEMYLTI